MTTISHPTTRPAAPERSLEQRMAALKNANRVRGYRADLKKRLNAGYTTGHAVIAAADPTVDYGQLETMKIFDLLIAMPKVGRVKANRWLTRARISPSKTLAGLTTRQRNELLSYLAATRIHQTVTPGEVL